MSENACIKSRLLYTENETNFSEQIDKNESTKTTDEF